MSLFRAALVAIAASFSSASSGDEAVPIAAVVPVLMRDESVRRELDLKPDQLQALDRLLQERNEPLFGLRMLSPETDAARIAETLDSFEAELAETLDDSQQARLRGLVLQANGWRSLGDAAVAAELRLTDPQAKKIAAVLSQTTEAARKLQESAGSSDASAALKKLADSEKERILRILSPAQQQAWRRLVGTKFDLASIRRSAGAAPELNGIAGWVNSDPQSLAGLRGRVVVFHFIAADCINCIRNLPHYQSWHERYADRNVTVLGVHSPETVAERDAAHVREELSRHGVTYPVALDAEMKTWNAWTNRMWPSTYLVDKRGQVRFWWYGELEWQGAGGESLMRQRIETLLAED